MLSCRHVMPSFMSSLSRTTHTGGPQPLQLLRALYILAAVADDKTNDNFLSALGKFAIDDSLSLERLSLAKMRGNKRARSINHI